MAFNSKTFVKEWQSNVSDLKTVMLKEQSSTGSYISIDRFLLNYNAEKHENKEK